MSEDMELELEPVDEEQGGAINWWFGLGLLLCALSAGVVILSLVMAARWW